MLLKTISLLIVDSNFLHNNPTQTSSDATITKFLIDELTHLGYEVGKVVIVPEIQNVISDEINTSVKYFDVVICVACVENTGSVYGAIAKSVSRATDLVISPHLSELEDTDVYVPRYSKVLHKVEVYPVVYLQRIFVLRGDRVRESFQELVRPHLRRYVEVPRYSRTLQVKCECIPTTGNGIKVDLEYKGDNQVRISSHNWLDIVQCLKKMDLVGSFEDYVESEWHEDHIREAVDNIKECLETYGVENTFICFNGGKDCTVLLHLVLGTLKVHFPYYKDKLACLYVQSQSPFAEQDEFISQCEIFYNLKIITYQSNIKDSLAQILARFPNYKACLMGTRRTDPFSSDLNVFQMSDPDWPQIMRVSPLLDWHYSDIWDYLLYYKVPYCKLYDMGFTSLGNTLNTTKNPALAYYDLVEEKEKYMPAYKLLEETKERNGRESS